MELSSLPVWAQQLGALILTACTAIAVTWNERRKKADPAEPANGEARVVAASFVERRQMEDLILVIRQLHGAIIDTNAHLKSMNDRMHEDEIVRLAVAKIKEDRGV
jgi:hypothetical protein